MILTSVHPGIPEIRYVPAGGCTKMLEIIIGIVIIVFCLGASSALVFYSRRQINRIARMKRSTYRDIIQSKHG
jgi:hypothetical protein